MHTIAAPPEPRLIPAATFGATNVWMTRHGKDYVAIDNLQDLEPFFLNIVGSGDQWLFCSSHGTLSAGRRSSENSLFPYYTVDKIIDNWNNTGPWTAMLADGHLWTPFQPAIAKLSPTKTRLLKSPLGDELLFEEQHDILNLVFSYSWRFSPKYGFVRKATIRNVGSQARSIRLVDGIDNILPSGVSSRIQNEYSCLADAYKISELTCSNQLLIHRLAAGITDEPIPLESLNATTLWTHGLGEGSTFLDRPTAEDFLQGLNPETKPSIRAKRGAYFLGRDLTLQPDEEKEWIMVADVSQSQADVSSLTESLAQVEDLVCRVEADILRGSRQLEKMVAAADGIQKSGDQDTSLYHYQNALCNIMRGGVPTNGYTFARSQFIDYLSLLNRPLVEKHHNWLHELPESFQRSELIALAKETQDPDLLRLSQEYLPLTLSRRHGDPSRPWNRFDIRVQSESGDPILYFEGNWRDIFQNWEALALSYPGYLGAFIAKFLNASTVDGFNPYRITSEGVDWETIDEEDPWASIGYWGDHQIVYLLKLLELELKVRPDALSQRLDHATHVFPDVPYRLKSFEDTLKDPRDTVTFDRDLHDILMRRKEEVGGDGLLKRRQNGEVVRVTLIEKLLLPAAVKLGNLIPGGGIWMNTQRPEWNDANNALAGCGLSIVTTGYLLRYLRVVEQMIRNNGSESFKISPELSTFLGSLTEQLRDPRWAAQEELSDRDRFDMVQAAGKATELHRESVYTEGPRLPQHTSADELTAFLEAATAAIEETLRINQRADQLWHSYNVLNIQQDERSLSVEHLPLMLEGQVSILSSGYLSAAQAVALLEELPNSELRSTRHETYLLYPDKEVTDFLDANQITTPQFEAICTLKEMVKRGDSRILTPDPRGFYRFHPALTNHYAVNDVLDSLQEESAYEGMVGDDRGQVLELYETVFNHRAFTGRSGRMFGYEGLGSVYWHMVSKLMLAVQEVALDAVEQDADDGTVNRLISSYFDVQSGLGYRRTPEQYGAFPSEPYSHSPSHAGAQQPGLTGQVKEGILCRFGELGVEFINGQLRFSPRLTRLAEFSGNAEGISSSKVSSGTIQFTFAGTPITYTIRQSIDLPVATVHLDDGSKVEAEKAILDQELTSEVARQTGKVRKIEVGVPAHFLIT